MRPSTMHRPGRGFSLLESLAALALVGFTLLGLAKGYAAVGQADELARLRGEAALLAQQRIEQLRGYTRIDTKAGELAWNDLASGADIVTGSATFTRRWSLGGSKDDPMRPLTMSVSWIGRNGGGQSLALNTVISRTDPADVGALGFPLPANTNLKRPMNRNLNIPLPATDIGQGESAFRLPNTNYAIVFSNDSGYVIKTCDLAAGATTITRDALQNCVTAHAYVLAGYISIDSKKTVTFPTDLKINTASLTGTSGTATCSVGAARDVAANTTLTGWQYYLCVINVPERGDAWSGRVRLASSKLQSDTLLVCRFEFPPAPGVSPNMRNVQPYTQVNESVDSQNYLLTSAASCPVVSGLQTVLHQDCRPSNPARATDCPNA